MKIAIIKLIVAFIRWQLMVGMENDNRYRYDLVNKLLDVEKRLEKESEE